MKQLICLIGFCLGFIACGDMVSTNIVERKTCTKEKLDTLQVSTFVAKLKDGTYECREISPVGEILWMMMPNFDNEDIPQLLLYANDTTHIKEFPVNPISSLFPYHLEDGTFILNECLLWTIEGIRRGQQFASLAPILHAGEGEQSRTLNGAELLEVLKSYKSWWEKVKGSDKLIKEVNPLEDTAWHW